MEWPFQDLTDLITTPATSFDSIKRQFSEFVQKAYKVCNLLSNQLVFINYALLFCIAYNYTFLICVSHHFPTLGPVSGSWGSWIKWSQCSQSCGGGTETRWRLCDSPAPAQGGTDCQGDDSQQRQCNTHQCRVPGANKSHIFSCESNSSIYCHL